MTVDIDKELETLETKWVILERKGPIVVLQMGKQSPFMACAVCLINSGGKSTGSFVDGSFCSNCGIAVGKIDEDLYGTEARKRKHD